MPSPRPRRRETSAERIELHRALDHPVRQRILRYLAEHGQANSTTLAESLSESTGTTSYHLRQLAEHGVIEEVAERSTGRQRWWRAIPQDVPLPPRAEITDEELAAGEDVIAMRIRHDIRLYFRSLAEFDGPDGWAHGSRYGAFMTKDEVHRFHREYLALLEKYGHRAEDAPEGARRMAVRFFMLPEEPEAPMDTVPED